MPTWERRGRTVFPETADEPLAADYDDGGGTHGWLLRVGMPGHAWAPVMRPILYSACIGLPHSSAIRFAPSSTLWIASAFWWFQQMRIAAGWRLDLAAPGEN